MFYVPHYKVYKSAFLESLLIIIIEFYSKHWRCIDLCNFLTKFALVSQNSMLIVAKDSDILLLSVSSLSIAVVKRQNAIYLCGKIMQGVYNKIIFNEKCTFEKVICKM